VEQDDLSKTETLAHSGSAKAVVGACVVVVGACVINAVVVVVVVVVVGTRGPPGQDVKAWNKMLSQVSR